MVSSLLLSCRKPIVAENRGTFLSSSSFFFSFLGVHFILLRARNGQFYELACPE
jgi:hypothetical protein